MNGLPADFIALMQQQWANQADSLFKGLEKDSTPVSIRVNPKKLNAAVNLPQIPWTKNGYYLAERPSFIHDPAWHAGAYYVQEASSMLLEKALEKIDTSTPIKALDLCGAPGGKTSHLAQILNDESLIVSNEVIHSRASILKQNVIQWGSPNVWVTNNDPKDFSALNSFFDLIVIDAPCSGEGMFRKDEAARNEWSLDNVKLCASRQKRIIDDVWDSLKPGGHIVYSTCTFNHFENEENLKWLSETKDIQWQTIELDISWNIHAYEENGIFGYHCFPGSVEGEGFFIAVGQKLSGEEVRIEKPYQSKKARKPQTLDASHWSDLIYNPENYVVESLAEGQEKAIQKEWLNDLKLLSKHLKVIYSGVYLGEMKKKNLIPSHDLAMSTILNQSNTHILDLDLETSLQYLRKDTFFEPSEHKGVQLVHFQNQSLGWVKHLGNRINSLLPSYKRVIKQPDIHNLWTLLNELN
tara:strand:- start:41 stop:1441 length:1401 start_codon:yes stop_codon:yes gene_type:complete